MKLTASAATKALTAAFLLWGSSSWAVTFDFAAVSAWSPGDATSWDSVSGTGERGYPSFSMAVGGLSMTASATLIPPGPPPTPLGPSNPGSPGPGQLAPSTPSLPPPAFVYLAGPGMGVCSALTTGDLCQPSLATSVDPGDILTLTFTTAVSLEAIRVRDAAGGSAPMGTLLLSVDGQPFAGHSLVQPLNLAPPLSGTVFRFASYDERYYIEALEVEASGGEPVPEPATLGLLGLGLLGAGWRARRGRR